MSVTFKISDIYSQADAWEAPNADYVAINASLGPDSALNRTQASTGIANLSTRTPIVVAFLLSANPDRIYLGHTVVAIYPGDPLATTPVDNSFIVLVGSQAESCIALALHDDATRKVNAAPVATLADIVAGHQANPITLRVPLGNSQDVANVHRVLLLPPTVSGPLLTNNPRGYLDQAQFYDQLLSVIIDQGDPIVLALWEPVRGRLVACGMHQTGHHWRRYHRRGGPLMHGRSRRQELEVQDPSRPQTAWLRTPWRAAVTAAHLMTGISDLRQTLVDTNTDRMVFDRDRAVKTLEDKHGAELTKVILRLCGAADEAGLPPVHRLLAFGPKAAGYGIIASLIGARIQSRCVPMDPTGAPLVTRPFCPMHQRVPQLPAGRRWPGIWCRPHPVRYRVQGPRGYACCRGQDQEGYHHGRMRYCYVG